MGGWLGTLWGGIKSIFRPLLNLKGSRIWQELAGLYSRVKTWFDWYRNHVHAHLQQMQAMRRQIYATFFQPILTIIDTIRRAAQVVGLISPKLAAKLNGIFLRIESAIRSPLDKVIGRANTLSGVIQSILTPLGFLDRATLLNTVWRDVGHLREILRNPLRGVIATGSSAPSVPVAEKIAKIDAYFANGSGPLATALNAKRATIDVILQQPR